MQPTALARGAASANVSVGFGYGVLLSGFGFEAAFSPGLKLEALVEDVKDVSSDDGSSGSSEVLSVLELNSEQGNLQLRYLCQDLHVVYASLKLIIL